jgi:hypothetical protein
MLTPSRLIMSHSVTPSLPSSSLSVGRTAAGRAALRDGGGFDASV